MLRYCMLSGRIWRPARIRLAAAMAYNDVSTSGGLKFQWAFGGLMRAPSNGERKFWL